MTVNKAYPSPKSESRFFYGYTVIIASFIAMLLAYGVRTSFGVFFKPLEAEFNWTRALISGAVTLSMVVQGLWGIYMGRVNDRVGSRWVITICSFFLGLGLLLVSITSFSWQLYIFYGLLIGLGMGGVFVSLLSTAARWFIKRRGLMTGIVMAGVGGGTLTMAPIANWLISLYGWRLSNVIIGGVVLIIGISAAQFLRRDPSKMGLVPYGQIEETRIELSSDTRGSSLNESTRTWQFWIVAVVYACIGYCTFTITTFVWSPSVLEDNGVFYMYYTGVRRGSTQSIMLATSTNPADPRSWQRQGVVLQPDHEGMIWKAGDWADCRDPSVMKIGDIYYMVYTGRDTTGPIIGWATAFAPAGPWRDWGATLTFLNLDLMAESPIIVSHAGLYYLFYNHTYLGEEYRIGQSQIGPWSGAFHMPYGWANEMWVGQDGRDYTSFLQNYKIVIKPYLWDDFYSPARFIMGESPQRLFFPIMFNP